MLTRWFHGYALVRRIESEGTRWLILRSGDGEWDLVHGERQKKESFRETASRAVSEQLGLNPTQDFLVSTMAILNHEFETILPGEATPRFVAVSFYPVDIYRACVLEKLDNKPHVSWVRAAELWQGHGPDGRQLNPVTQLLVRRFEIIQPWQD